MLINHLLKKKCINKLSLAISLKFPECATLATTLTAKAWALAAIFVSEDMPEKLSTKGET